MTWTLTALASRVMIYLTMWKFPTAETLQLVLLFAPLAVGSVLTYLVAAKKLYLYETAREWQSANITCVLYTLAFAFVPPLMAVIWRGILNIRECLRNKRT